MKIRNFLRMLLCSVVLFSAVSCLNDDDEPEITIDPVSYFTGDIHVTQPDGVTFTDKSVRAEIISNADNQTFTMIIRQVKFAEAMPIRLDMTVEGLSYTQSGSSIVITGNNIVPTAMGGPFEQYIITNFKGSISEGPVFSFETNCGPFKVTYTGKI